MFRTQIQITEQQAKMLRELALSTHQSIAALIRQAVDRFLLSAKPNRSTLYHQAASVAGKHKADRDDISLNHDQYLDEAFEG